MTSVFVLEHWGLYKVAYIDSVWGTDIVLALNMPLQALCTSGPNTGCVFDNDSTVPTPQSGQC